jgi:DNA polymerase III subunit delta
MSEPAREMKPAYLFSGDDEAKLSETRARLRERAEREGGRGALETFVGEGKSAPDADALVGSLLALSLGSSRRYLLADGVQAWGKAQSARVVEALGQIPEDTSVVLIARGKAPAALVKAVEATGGEAKAYSAPKPREVPKRLVEEARARGFTLAPDAARLLVERMGTSRLRLSGELDRLALWAGEQRSVELADLEAMIADTSESAAWSLADAVVEGDTAAALTIAERLIAQGESVTGLAYMLSSRLRAAAAAAAELEAGRPAKQVADGLPMHPYAAKMLVQRIGDRAPGELREAVGAIADLVLWCRGGSDYSEGVALTLALRRATGAGDAEPLAA